MINFFNNNKQTKINIEQMFDMYTNSMEFHMVLGQEDPNKTSQYHHQIPDAMGIFR
jgi:hypothetical protein